MHYFITSPCSFTPPLVQARAPKWTFFNHHSTVVFWLIQSLKAHKFTVCGRHGRQHETPHIILCAAWKLISFTLWPNKSLPRLKQNANSTLLRFCVLQSKLLCQKKTRRGVLKPKRHEGKTDLWHQAECAGLQVSPVISDGGARDFPGQCPLSKGCKIRPGPLALNYQTV